MATLASIASELAAHEAVLQYVRTNLLVEKRKLIVLRGKRERVAQSVPDVASSMASKLSTADHMFEAHEYAAARVLYMQYLRFNPRHGGAWLRCAWCDSRCGDNLDAVLYCVHCSLCCQHSFAAWGYLATLRLRVGDILVGVGAWLQAPSSRFFGCGAVHRVLN